MSKMSSNRYIVLLLILLSLVAPSYGQVVSPLEFSKSFDGRSTGIIRTIEISQNEIWLGAENGLFRIAGADVLNVNSDNSILKTNYISDISNFDKSNILVAVFGDGLYLVNKRTHDITPFEIEGLDTRSTWKADVSNNYVAISTIRDLHIIDKNTRKNLVSFSSISPDSITDIRHVAIYDDNVWWLDITKGLRRLEIQTKSISYFPTSTYFANADVLTALLVEEENVLVGSNENIYSLEKSSLNVRSIINDNRSWQSVSDAAVFKLLRDPAGTLWVASDRLYQVDEKKRVLLTPKILYPLLSSSAAELVLDFTFDKKGNLFAADTQRGLFAIPSKASSVEFLGGDLEVSSDAIYDVAFAPDSTIYFTRENKLSAYDFDSKEIVDFILSSPGHYSIIATAKEHITLVSKLGVVEIIDTASRKSRIVDRLADHYDEDAIVTDVVSADGKTVYMLVKGTSEDELIRWRDGEITKIFEGRLNRIALGDKSTLFVSSPYDGIYKLTENGRNVDLEKISARKFSGLACLYQDEQQRLWMCGDGEGLFYIDSAKQLKVANNFKHRYIRGIRQIDTDKYMVATNSGLYLYDLQNATVLSLGKGFGISDVDFEYDALYSDDQNLVVIGDNYSYRVHKKSLKEKLERYSDELPHVIFTAPRVYDSEDGRVKGVDKRLYEDESNKLTIFRNETLFDIELVVSDYIEKAESLIEYRLIGSDDLWQEADHSTARVTFSSLPHGTYELQTRIKSDLENMPINSLIIHVAPPWWLTLYAFICYILVFIVVLSFGIRALKKRLNAQSEALSGKVDEQRHELTHTQTYIKTLLSRKHQVFLKVAREVQTPLALILGPLQYIKENPNDTGNGQRINVMARNAKRLHLLINQMTEIEQLEQSKKRKKQTYQIRQHIPRLLANLEPVISQKNICLSTRLRATGAITLLSGSLEKIFYSLVTSVLERCTEGTEIALHTRCEALHLVIQIRDSEPAMSEEEQASIFDNVASYGDKTEGDWSPKLSLVREATLANAGWFGLDSDPVKGNCFSVYLPLINLSEGLSASAPAVTEVLPKLPRVETNRPVVLIVEDNPDMRQYLADALKSDYNCLESTDGKHALQVMAAVPTCLVISDTNMPYCDGYQLISAMKADSRFNHIPFLLISEVPSTNIMQKCVDLGIDNVLVKPVDIGELRYTVHNLVGRYARSSHEKNSVNALSPFAIPEFENARDQAFYTRFINLLAAHYQEEGFGKLEAASALAMSDRQLSRKLRAIFAMSFSETLKEYRIHRAKIMLSQGHQVTEVAYEVGFNTTSYFSRSFKASCNETPSQYQDRIAEAPAN